VHAQPRQRRTFVPVDAVELAFQFCAKASAEQAPTIHAMHTASSARIFCVSRYLCGRADDHNGSAPVRRAEFDLRSVGLPVPGTPTPWLFCRAGVLGVDARRPGQLPADRHPAAGIIRVDATYQLRAVAALVFAPDVALATDQRLVTPTTANTAVELF
jgi:hypothetical protein